MKNKIETMKTEESFTTLDELNEFKINKLKKRVDNIEKKMRGTHKFAKEKK